MPHLFERGEPVAHDPYGVPLPFEVAAYEFGLLLVVFGDYDVCTHTADRMRVRNTARTGSGGTGGGSRRCEGVSRRPAGGGDVPGRGAVLRSVGGDPVRRRRYAAIVTADLPRTAVFALLGRSAKTTIRSSAKRPTPASADADR